MSKKIIAGVIIGSIAIAGAATGIGVGYSHGKNKYEVNIVSELESAEFDGAGKYKIGQEVELSAKDVEGYRFVYWDLPNREISRENPYKFTLTTANYGTYTAVYEKEYTITVGQYENGTVTSDRPVAIVGEEVELIVAPEDNYYLSNISYTTSSGTTTIEYSNGYKFLMPEDDVTINATFAQSMFNVDVAEIANGSVQVSSTSGVNGTEITVSATAETGYELDELYYIAEGSTTHTEITDGTFTLTSDVTVYATFKAIDYSIVIPDNVIVLRGTERLTSESKIHYGDELTISYTETTGYHKTTFEVTGASLKEGNTYTVTENVTVSYAEEKDVFDLTQVFGQYGYFEFNDENDNYAGEVYIVDEDNQDIEDWSAVEYGTQVKLRVWLDEAYTKSTLTVKVNGAVVSLVLEEDNDAYFTVTITGVPEITVEGAEINKYTITVINDTDFVCGIYDGDEKINDLTTIEHDKRYTLRASVIYDEEKDIVYYPFPKITGNYYMGAPNIDEDELCAYIDVYFYSDASIEIFQDSFYVDVPEDPVGYRMITFEGELGEEDSNEVTTIKDWGYNDADGGYAYASEIDYETGEYVDKFFAIELYEDYDASVPVVKLGDTTLTPVRVFDYLDIDGYEATSGKTYIYSLGSIRENGLKITVDGIVRNQYRLLGDDAYELAYCPEDVSGTFEVSSEYKGIPVTSIGDCVFQNRDINVTLPSTIKNIGNFAFEGCTTDIDFSVLENLETIGAAAFARSGVTKVVLSQTVTNVGAFAFNACQALEEIEVYCEDAYFESSYYDDETGDNYNGYYTFANCPNLEKVYWAGPYFSSEDAGGPFANCGTNVETGMEVTIAGNVEDIVGMFTHDTSYCQEDAPNVKKLIIEADTAREEIFNWIPNSDTGLKLDEMIVDSQITFNWMKGNAYKTTENDGSYSQKFYIKADLDGVDETDKLGAINDEWGNLRGYAKKQAISDREGYVLYQYVIEEADESDFEVEEYEEGVEITGYNGSDYDLIIPNTINGKNVLKISGIYNDFNSIYFPSTVKAWGYNGFRFQNGYVKEGENPTIAIENQIIYLLVDGEVIAVYADPDEGYWDNYDENWNSNPRDIVFRADTTIIECIFNWTDGSISSTSINWEDLTSLKKIEDNAFYMCSSVEGELVIPASLREVGSSSFSSLNCSKVKFLSDNLIVEEDYNLFEGELYWWYNEIEELYIGSAFGYNNALLNNKVLGNLVKNAEKIIVPKSIYDGSNPYLSAVNFIVEEDDENYYFSIKNEVFYDFDVQNHTATLVSYTGSDSAFVIPEKITHNGIEYTVTKIGDAAFSNCTNLTSISIPSTIEVIGWAAFSGCSNLTYTEYNGARYLGNSDNPYVVLINATNSAVTSFTIPSTTKIIYHDAFKNFSALTSIVIPEGVTYVGSGAFSNARAMTSVTLPSTLKQVDSMAFRTNSTLRVNISDLEAFFNIYNNAASHTVGYGSTYSLYLNGTIVNELTIPSSVTDIKQYAFVRCSSITKVIIPSTVNTIRNSAFYSCANLQTIIFEGGIEGVAGYAFNLSNVTTIVIGSEYVYNNFNADWGSLFKDIENSANTVKVLKLIVDDESNSNENLNNSTRWTRAATTETINGQEYYVYIKN